ncbi:MAG TPA: hypothetical protein VGB42_01120 [Candidatus Thermoplasmatota archaeon]
MDRLLGMLRVIRVLKDRVLGMPSDEAAELDLRRPMGAAGLAGGLGAGGIGAVLAGTLAVADPRVIGLAQQSGISFPGAPAGLFMVALGGVMVLAGWGVWLLRAWAWWASLALALVALALTLGSVPWMLGALVLIVYLANIRGVFDGASGMDRLGGRAAY